MKKNSKKSGADLLGFVVLGFLAFVLGRVSKIFSISSKNFSRNSGKKMELYFLRHAIAIEPEEFKGSDVERPLSAEGRKKMIEEVQGMKALGISFDTLLSSPLLRARQTAELVKKHLPFAGEIQIEPLLIPGSNFEKLIEKLTQRDEKSVMLVGHEPSLSLWIQALIGMRQSLRLKKGGLCHLLLEEDGARSVELLALFPPKSLRLKS